MQETGLHDEWVQEKIYIKFFIGQSEKAESKILFIFILLPSLYVKNSLDQDRKKEKNFAHVFHGAWGSESRTGRMVDTEEVGTDTYTLL